MDKKVDSDFGSMKPLGQFIENDMDSRMAETMGFINNPGSNIDLLAEVSPEAVLPISRLLYKARLYRNDGIPFVINHYLRLTVSKERKGRVESVGIMEKVLTTAKEILSALKTTVMEHT